MVKSKTTETEGHRYSDSVMPLRSKWVFSALIMSSSTCHGASCRYWAKKFYNIDNIPSKIRSLCFHGPPTTTTATTTTTTTTSFVQNYSEFLLPGILYRITLKLVRNNVLVNILFINNWFVVCCDHRKCQPISNSSN